MINTFRIVAFLEGVSYLLLMAASLDKKFFSGSETYVGYLGMPHGLLFLAYIAFAIFLQTTYKWNTKTFAIILIASLLPFGTFYVDKKILKPLA